MSPDEARDLFSEAFDGELDEAKQAAFDALLDEDAELRADYDDFVETFTLVGELDEREPIPVPNLLPKIQDRLRRRSRGRYYRDRFSQNAGRFTWLVMLLAVVTVMTVLGAVVYAVQTNVADELAPSAPEAEPAPEAPDPATP